MAKHKVTILVDADDIMQAQIVAQGAQNLIDAFAVAPGLLLEISDKATADKYTKKITGLINNPVVKKLAGALK